MNTIETPITFEIVPPNSGLELKQEEALQSSFAQYFQQAAELKLSTAGITDPKEARAARLEIRKVRTGAEATRKKLKEESLRMGKAIDGANNILLALIVPIEESMENIEKAAERAEKAAMEARIAERTEKLNGVGAMVPNNLGWLTDDQFAAILKDAAELQRIRAEREEKERVERLAQIEAERIERERITVENERLRAEAEETARLAKIESDRIAAERAEEQRLAKIELEKREAEFAAERAEAIRLGQLEVDKLAAERAKEQRLAAKKEEAARQERLEVEAKAKAEREQLEAEAAKARKELEEANAKVAAAQAEALRVQKLEAAAKAKAAKAPDSEKLAVLLTSIKSLSVPTLSTDEGKTAVAKIRAILNTAYAQIKAVSAEF